MIPARFDLEDVGHYDNERSKAMVPSEHGEWVRYEDIEHLLRDRPFKPSAQPETPPQK